MRYTLVTRAGSRITKAVAQYTEAMFTSPYASEVSVLMATKTYVADVNEGAKLHNISFKKDSLLSAG